MKKSKLIKSMLVLAALLLSVGQMWGQSFTFENSNSTTSVTTNNITYTCNGSGTSTTRFGSSLKFMNLGSGKQMQFVSTTNNISRIEIKACANNSAAKKCMTIKTSADASSYSVPSTFTATLDGSSAESVEDMSLTGTSASDWQTLVINFNANATLPMAFQILRGSNNLSVYSVKVYTAPTALATSDVTSEGVTFTVTDGASTNNYDIYYSKSTSVPNSGTSASTTISSAKTKSITGLESGQTYYAWVRSTWSSGTIKGDWRPSTASVSFTTESAGGGCGSTEQAALTLSSSSGTICGTGTATFTVSGGSGSGALSVSSSDETKATASIDGSTVTVTGVAAGSATITVTKACDATYAEKTATYSATVAAVPTANAGADKVTEPETGVALAATAAASGCTGAWTIQSGPNTATSQLSSTSSATATFTPTEAGTYTLRWTVTNSTSGCSAYDDMTVTAAVCSISDCGNATLTYAINASTSVTNTAANLISSATASNTTAMGINGTAALAGITISDSSNPGKAAATTSACYPTAPTMSSKIGMYNGAAYSSSNYLQFAFTVKTGYTFTPCDIEFTVQPVSYIGNFRWEVTDGTDVYGYGVATNVPKGSDGGASVLTGLTSTEEMEAGDYYIRLYPYYNGSNTFRISNDVILKGTTASAGTCVDKYSFHYGPTTGDWETPICFTQVGSTHEWNITNFTIPSHSGGKFWVGHHGETNSQSVTRAWTDSYSDGNGAMKLLPTSTSIVGQATGAVGTINIWDDSGWKNQNVGFTPNGYGITYGGSGHAFHTTATNHMLETDVVTLPNVSTTYTMGLATATAGTYVTCAHSKAAEAISAMGVTVVGKGGKAIYLVPGPFNADGAKYAVYDVTNTAFDTDFMSDADGDGIYVGYVGSNCTSMILCRMNSDATTSDLSSKNWDKRWNQTANISISGDLAKKYTITNMTTWNECAYTTANMQPITGQKGKFRMWDDSGSDNWYVHWIPYYVLSYDANGGTGTTAQTERNSESSTLTVSTAANGFTAPNGYQFAGWATSDARADAGTVDYAAGASYTLTSNATLYAVWECVTPTFSTNLSTSTVNYNVGDAASALTVAATAGGGTVTYQWYSNTANSTTTPTPTALTTGASYTPSTAAAGTTYYFCVATNTSGSCATTVTSNITPVTVTAAAVLTALECNTRYTVQDMTAGGCGTLSTTSCYSAGLSANNRFEVLGDPSKTDQAGGTPEQKTNTAQTINSISFNSFMYLKGDGLNGSTEPTCRGVKFIIPSAGKLTIYYRYGDRSKLKKEGEDAVNVGTTTDGYGYNTHDVTAGTYYIYGASSGAVLIAVEYQCCTTPAAPTGFTAGSITSTGATFSITDAGDAASYDIYYSESSTAPTAGTAATTTSTEKTKAVTGLTANTTYYAWVRSVCDADHKSAWFALGTTSFTTAAAEPEALVHWTLNLNSNTWGTSTTPTTTDGTNITSISTSADSEDGTREGTTKKVSLASASDNVDKAASFTFTVNSAKKVEPERVTCQVFNVGGSSGGQLSYKAQLSDNNGHIYYSTNTVVPDAEATLTDATFTFASDLVLTGNVTIKVYGWKSGSAGSAFRMGQHVKLFGEVQNAADYTVTHTLSNVTKSAGATSVKEGNNYTATYASAGGYALPSTITVTIGGSSATAGTDYTWTQGTGVVSIPGNKVTGNIVITVTGAAIVHHDVTFSLTNVVYSSGDNQGTDAATEGSAFSTVFAASSGYDLPSTITVTIGGAAATVGTDYTWNSSTGAFEVPAAKVTGDIVVTIVGEEHVESSCITITNFATSNTNNATGDGQNKMFYGYKGSVSDANAITITSNDGNDRGQNSGAEMRLTYGKKMRIYADNTIDGAPATFSNVVSVSFKWKFIASGNSGTTVLNSTYTVKVGNTTIANAVAISGKTTDGYATVTINNLAQLSGYIEFQFGGSSSSYNVYLDDIEICTADMDACTTPTIPTLTNQDLCSGVAASAWNATVSNAAAIEAAGESVSYKWQKKNGSNWDDISGATSASYDVDGSGTVTEAMAGTYRVVVTVSKAGKSSSTANREVTLTVNEATEVTAITADKATVYPTNSVTLTATANMDATWQWYTCTNAEGAGESSIGGATSASYTIASAGAAGTYYYKAEATGSCGTDEMVYTLTVSAAAGGDCFHFVSVIPESNINISSGASIVTPTHATTLEGGTMNVGSQQVVITAGYGLKMEGTKTVSITLDAALEAGNVVIVKGTSGTKGYGITINGVNFYDADNKTFDVSYTVLADDGLEGQTALTVSKYSGSSYLQEVKITGCGESCTDPEVTASANNTTACAGSSVTFTATGAHASAAYQWQKLDGTWTNISGATESTYTIASVVAGDAGKYRVIATHDCSRTSNEVTLSVPSAPDFGSTVPASVSVMQTIALSINTVEATDAVKYKWYKSADATWDAGDTEIGTNKELIKAYDSEATGTPSYYIFCRAQNACGITTSTAIAVTVTAYVEEDCATRGNEGDAAFSFENSGCGQGSYQSANCWTMNSNSKILVYYPPTGKYFKTAKVTIASSSESKASYNWSTNGGTDFTAVSLTVNSTLTERTIDLSTHGNVNAFQIGRNFDSKGSSGGTLYVSKICFEYTDACTATTVTPSGTGSETHTIGSSFTEPTFTVKHGGTAFDPQPTLTYSSSNEDIALVDDDGTVTFNGEAGTVTITASYAGGTISATEYCASSGSYTITVSCPGGAPKVVVADGSVNMSGCNSSVTLRAKTQADGDFADGTYQWFRNGEEIDGATSSSYTATQAGTYTVARTNTSDCTTPSTNSAIVTSTATEPEVERLVPFQYYHVDKTYSDQMKMRHLFAVKNSGKLDGKSFKMYVSRNGGAATDVTSSNALVVVPSGDGHVDTVMVDLNKLSGKYSKDDELVFTCKAIDCTPAVSEVYKNTITMNVIGTTPTLALICSGSSKAGGTRKTSELTVGGDFLTGYNVADLCQQTGNTSFDANTEWGLYTNLKANYIVTPVNGYAVFNKLNYEPFDILLLTDYPKASKSDAAADVLDDMAALCDYRPMLSFKTHMVAKSPSKWAEKGFTTSPVVTKADGRLNLNIVCYAHPMFEGLKSGEDVYTDVGNTSAPLVYTMLTGTGYESSKGMQGFELAAAENFITIGLTHYNGTIAKDSPDPGEVEWTPGSEDRMLVTVAERQANPEARFILFSLNIGAHSKLTDKGEEVVLACLNYLLGTAEGTIEPADCSFTFDNGESNEHDASWYSSNCPLCTGTKGDGLWTTAANWGPDYRLLPGEFTSVRIKKPVEVDDTHAHVMEVRLIDEGSIDIPAGKALDVKSTIRRMDGSEIYPTEISDLTLEASTTSNGTLIFNNSTGDSKATVWAYSKGFISEGVKNYQYIGTPFNELNALYNYYGSWIYSWSFNSKKNRWGWVAVKNGGPMHAWTGYCISQESPTYYETSGTMTATGTVDIAVPAGENMVVGNSWTAPLYIKEFTDDDFENLVGNVYFFNTGVDKTGEGATTASATGDARWTGGTYVSIPIHASSYTGDSLISSMQGFFVKSNGSAGALHLDYDRHVRPSTNRNILSGELHAPARRAALDSNEPEVLKIKVSGENYDDKLLLLAREDFTTGFDNGWDGDKWDGNESSLYIYTTDEEGTENSVSAIPELEGTIIGFRAGGEDDAYTLHFECMNSDEELYLYDTETNTYTQILTGATYRFFTSDKEKHARFIITRNSPQTPTDIGNGEASGSTRAKKFILNDKMFIMVNGMLYDATGKVVK